MQSLNQALLDKQKAGIPLTGPEAREMIGDLNRIIAKKGDATLEMLLLAAVGSRYYRDVWDLLIIAEGAASDETDLDC